MVAASAGDRIDAPCVLDGPVNGDAFRAYVEQLLVPTLAPGDVVVMANLGSHKTRPSEGPSGSLTSATVRVNDDDSGLAEVSIVRTSTDGAVEGTDVTFRVRIGTAHSANLVIPLVVSEVGSFLFPANQVRVHTGVITAGQTHFNLRLTTGNDNVDEPDGTVTATVDAGSGYTVSSTLGRATAKVSDNDGLPTVSVSPPTGEGINTVGGALTLPEAGTLDHGTMARFTVAVKPRTAVHETAGAAWCRLAWNRDRRGRVSCYLVARFPTVRRRECSRAGLQGASA